MKVFGDGIPGAVGQRRVPLLPGLEVAWINRSCQIRQGFSGGAERELCDAGRLSAVVVGLEHWIEPLWVSMRIV